MRKMRSKPFRQIDAESADCRVNKKTEPTMLTNHWSWQNTSPPPTNSMSPAVNVNTLCEWVCVLLCVCLFYRIAHSALHTSHTRKRQIHITQNTAADTQTQPSTGQWPPDLLHKILKTRNRLQLTHTPTKLTRHPQTRTHARAHQTHQIHRTLNDKNENTRQIARDFRRNFLVSSFVFVSSTFFFVIILFQFLRLFITIFFLF